MAFPPWFGQTPARAGALALLLVLALVAAPAHSVDVTELVLNSFDLTVGKEPTDYWNTSATQGSAIAVEYVLNPTVHGNGSARIDFTLQQADASGGRLSWQHISKVKYDLAGGNELSFWYYIESPSSLPDRTSLQFTLLDGAGLASACEGQCDYNAFEHYTWTFTTAGSAAGWEQVTIDLTAAASALKSSSGTADNEALDAEEILGFSFDFVIDGSGEIGSEATGTLYIDGLAVTGPEVLNHKWSSQAWIDELVVASDDPSSGWTCEERGLLLKTYSSQYAATNTNLSSQIDADGDFHYLDIEWAAEESASWGGYTQIEEVLPHVAYFNFSQAQQLSFDLNVLKVASESGHVNFRAILFDADGLADYSWKQALTEHYYSFFKVFDDATDGWTTLRVNLTGTDDASSPFYRPGWSGSEIDNVMNKATIKGFMLSFNVDASDNLNSKYTGHVHMGNYQARPDVVNSASSTGSDGVADSEVLFDIFDDDDATIVSLMATWQDCAQSCMDADDCNYWSHRPVDQVVNCALINKVSTSQVAKKSNASELEAQTTSGWISTRRPFACGDEGVCTCTTTSIDCSLGGRRLTNGSSSSDLAIFPDLSNIDSSLVQSINLANTSIAYVSAPMLGGLEHLTKLDLGASVAWFTTAELDVLPRLEELKAEALIQMITDPNTEFFGDLCCDLGAPYTIGNRTWYGCEYQEEPISCATENFVAYSETIDTIVSIDETNEKFGWGAATADACCELCTMYSGCRYWFFDNRWTNSENACTLKTSGHGRVESHNWKDLACEDLTQIDWCQANQDKLDPGYIAGHVASVQAELGEVSVSLSVSQTDLSVDNDFTRSYNVTVAGLGSGRGTVRVTPQLVEDIDGVEIWPTSLPFYYGQAMTKTIRIRAAIPATDGSSISVQLTHVVEGCDLAWDYLSEGSNITTKFVVVPQVCPAGMYLPSGATECSKCFKGAYCPGGEGEEAEPQACQPKTYNPLAGSDSAAACLSCPAGKFSKSLGASACEMCSLGRYSNEEDGASSCEACEQGAFANVTGLTQCYACPAGMQSLGQGSESESDCGCAAGSFSMNGSDTCYDCTEGSTCAGMDAAPEALAGYHLYSIDHGTLRIFSCSGETTQCPGGPVGTCAPGRHGYICSECEPGLRQAADGTCTPCSGGDKALLISVFIVGFALIIVLYLEIAKKTGKQVSKSLLTQTTLGNLFVFAVQVLAALHSLSIEWTDPVSGSVERASLLGGFNLDIIYAPCWDGFNPVTKYASSVLCVLAATLLIVVTHGVKSYWSWKHRGVVPDRAALYNTCGTLMQALYVTIVMTLLSPLFCTSHPSGDSTVATRPSVLCWQGGDHTTMMILGALSASIPISYLATVTHATWRYPRAMVEADIHFCRNFRFFFQKFRPRVYWYPLWIAVRNWFVTFSLIPSDTLTQLVSLQVVMIGSGLMALKTAPFHMNVANIVECIQLVALMFLLCVGQTMVGMSGQTAVTLGAFALFLSLCSVPAFVLMGLQHCWRSKQKRYQCFLCNHSGSSSSFARLLKLTLGSSAYLHADNPVDLDLAVDLVAFQTKRLVVLVTDAVFTNLNCLAEMTAARNEQVPITVVTLPSVHMPVASIVEELPYTVPNLVWLQTLGMTIATVQQAVSEVLILPVLKMMPRLTSSTVLNLQALMLEGVTNDAVVAMGEEDKLAADTGKIFILADMSDWTAASASQVLSTLLWASFRWEPNRKPQVVPYREVLPKRSDIICLLVCSPGLLGHESILDSIMVIRTLNVATYPITTDSSFSVPSKSAQHTIRGDVARLHRSADAILDTYFNLFMDATLEFPMECGLLVLEARSETLARRIQRRLLKDQGSGSGSSLSLLKFGASSMSAMSTKPTGDSANEVSGNGTGPDNGSRKGSKTPARPVRIDLDSPKEQGPGFGPGQTDGHCKEQSSFAGGPEDLQPPAHVQVADSGVHVLWV